MSTDQGTPPTLREFDIEQAYKLGLEITEQPASGALLPHIRCVQGAAAVMHLFELHMKAALDFAVSETVKRLVEQGSEKVTTDERNLLCFDFPGECICQLLDKFADLVRTREFAPLAAALEIERERTATKTREELIGKLITKGGRCIRCKCILSLCVMGENIFGVDCSNCESFPMTPKTMTIEQLSKLFPELAKEPTS